MTDSPRFRPGDQPPPVDGEEYVEDAVIERIRQHAAAIGWAGSVLTDRVERESRARFALGLERYHKRLQTHNGRDARRDALDELLDAHHYLTQFRLERKDNGRFANNVLDLIFDILHQVLQEEGASAAASTGSVPSAD